MYLGNQPALAYTSFAKQDFTTSATTNYVLDQAVTNANEIALFINFVRQEPTTAYTASGTTLTLTSATTAGDDMYCIFLGKAVGTINPPAGSVGASQITDGSITPAKLNLNDNLLFNTANKGIYLGVTSATASNLLNDYEEGTWTPSVIGGSISGTSISYIGKYVKIGGLVFLYFNAYSASNDIVVSSYVQFDGLPFTFTYGGTSSITTEDIDIFARQGFATLSNTRLSLSASGSNPGTTSLKVGIIGLTI